MRHLIQEPARMMLCPALVLLSRVPMLPFSALVRGLRCFHDFLAGPLPLAYFKSA
jgi:hypothetical protein